MPRSAIPRSTNEAAGNRSIYHDGWMAAVVHNVTWEPAVRADFDHDKW